MFSTKIDNNSFSLNELLIKKEQENLLETKPTTYINIQSPLHIRIVGPKESGKTTFVIRLKENRFESFYIPSITHEQTQIRCMLHANVTKIIFTVEDIETFDINSLSKEEFLFVFFDESSLHSYEIAKTFIERNTMLYNSLHNKDMFLIGNKSDIKSHHLDINSIEEFCKRNQIIFSQISVRNNRGIPDLMKSLDNYFISETEYNYVYSAPQTITLL